MHIQQVARVVAVGISIAAIGPAGTGLRAAAAPMHPAGMDFRAVTEIVRDITEMSASSHPRRPHVIVQAVDREPGHFAVYLNHARTASVVLDLTSEQWATSEFATVARALFLPAAEHGGPGLHEVLSDLNPRAMVTANTAVSASLRANIRDASAHESAALLLAAFALRPAAASSSTRWAVNRMTAHLAISRALRGGSVSGVDGELAEIARLALVGLDAQAQARIDIRTMSRGAEAQWLSILRMQVAGDSEQVASTALADGHSSEAADRHIYEQMHGRPMRKRSEALPAGGAMGPNGVEVLPWAAWAEAARRHAPPQ
jgi:hypothetical protein